MSAKRFFICSTTLTFCIAAGECGSHAPIPLSTLSPCSRNAGKEKVSHHDERTRSATARIRRAVKRLLALPLTSVSGVLHKLHVLHVARQVDNGYTSTFDAEVRGLLDFSGHSQRISDRDSFVRLGHWGPVIQQAYGSPSELSDGESHIDQLIATFAQVGRPIDTVIESGNIKTSVRDLVDCSRSCFVIGQEASWSIVAYLVYLPKNSRWTNRFGETVSYDQIIGDFATSRLGTGPCYGTHNLYALSLALNIDEDYCFLSRATRKAARDKIVNALQNLSQSMARDGSWTKNWSGDNPTSKADDFPSRVLITAHHLEWAMLAKRVVHDIPENDIGLTREFLLDALEIASDSEFRQNYCAYSHAASALLAGAHGVGPNGE